jgi:hypothetical protein
MDIYRKLLVLCIVLIFMYIIFRLLWKRIQLRMNYEKLNMEEYSNMEGYDNINVNYVLQNNSAPLSIKNDLSQRLNNIGNVPDIKKPDALYLRNYAIKASMNSAYNGTENTVEMIEYVLSRGCRFLDFEIYKDPTPGSNNSIISISKSSGFIPIPETTRLTLNEAILFIDNNGFNSISPNSGDPLFIQFRPRDPTPSDPDHIDLKRILSDIAKAVSSTSSLYSGTVGNKNPITSTTDIKTLLGKIVIVMDTTLYPDYGNMFPGLKDYVNMENSHTNGETDTILYGDLPKQTQLQLSSDKYSSDVSKIREVLFIDRSGMTYNTNVNTSVLYEKYVCQIIPMMFWSNSSELYNYEVMFNQCGGGIVPLSSIYKKIVSKQHMHIEYPEPVFAIPTFGNQTITFIVITALVGIAGFIIMKK